MREFLSKEFPLYANLIVGGLFIFIFTGTWLLMNDLKSLLSRDTHGITGQKLRSLYIKIKIRRIVALLAGAVLIILYFLEKNMSGMMLIIFGSFWLYSAMLTGNSRRFIQTIYRK